MSFEDVVAGRRDWYVACGDAQDVLRTMPDKFAQTCITSPPYFGLRDYGIAGQIGLEESPEEYVERLKRVFREVRRVLRDDGTLWLNLGDSYASHGSGSDGKELAWLGTRSLRREARKPPSGLKPKDLIGIPWRVAFALQADGWFLRSDIIWHKPNAMPESVTDRPTKAHEYIFLLTKSKRYYYDHESIKEEAVNGDPKPPRGSQGVIDNPLNGGRRKQDEVGKRQYTDFNERYQPVEKRNKRDVWTVATQPFAGSHYATFPTSLIDPCVLAGAPEGGIVLDPFAGSGTTGVSALRQGKKFVGIDLSPENVSMSQERIVADSPLLNGIGGSKT